MASEWRPNEEGLAQILGVLREVNNAAVQRQVQESIHAFSQYPEWAQYLAFVFARCDGEAPAVRTFAGLLLKNYLAAQFEALPGGLLAALKAAVLGAVADPNGAVRRTAAQLVSSVLLYGELDGWPELLPRLVAALDAPPASPALDGALQALALVCEDHKQLLDEPQFGRPLQHIAPRMLELLARCPSEPHRLTALGCVAEFLVDFPGTLVSMQAQLLQALFAAGADPSWRIRSKAARAFVTLAELHIDVLLQAMPQAIALLLQLTQDPDETTALEACEFWQAVSEHPEARDSLRPALPQIVPLLLSKMVYAQQDIQAMLKEDEASLSDATANPRDVRPVAASSSAAATSKGEDEDEDDDDDDDGDYEEPSDWNIRKCASAGLDYLSSSMGDDLLPVLIQNVVPPLSAAAADSPGSSWVHQEVAILSLGAVAEGCAEGMQQHLPQVLPFLIAMLSHQVSIIRSITCWTLSRYARWVVEDAERGGFEPIFKPLLVALLSRIHDPVRRVQESAATALATLEEEAGEDLEPFAVDVLRTIMDAFVRYEHRGLLILYDTIGTFAEAIGHSIARPEFIGMLMPPLIARWNAAEDTDPKLVPLLECLSSVASALGVAFQQYAEPVYARCIRLIKHGLEEEANWAKHPTEDQSDRDLIICSLDLLAGMCGALGQAMDTLVPGTSLMPMLVTCLQSPSSDVRQSACALTGDLSRASFNVVRIELPRIVPLLVSNTVTEFPRICANASWAFGEVTLRDFESVRKSVPSMLQRILPIVRHPRERGGLRIIVDNAAACLGRIALVSPESVAPQLSSFLQQWCTITRYIRDEREKLDTIRGLSKLVQTNPTDAVPGFYYVLLAFNSITWENLDQDRAALQMELVRVCHGFKSALGESWIPFWNELPAELRADLQQKYQL